MENQQILPSTDINIEKVQFCFLKIKTGAWSFTMKNKPNYGLIFIKNGSMIIERNGKKTLVKKGDLLFLPMNGTHTVKSVNAAEEADFKGAGGFQKGKPAENGDCAFYTTSFYAKVSPDFFIKDFLTLSRFNKFDGLFSELERLSDDKRFGAGLKAKGIIYDIIYNAAKEFDLKCETSAADEGLFKVVNFINENYADKITLDDLSDVSGYSKSYFKKIFLRKFGVTPHRYIMNLRVDLAKTMIDSGVFTFKEIAEKCGFLNEYYFSAAFKKITGVSPKNYR